MNNDFSENKNGTVEIEITQDSMKAGAIISPPDDKGKPVELEDLHEAIKRAGIVVGVKDDIYLSGFVEEGKMYMVEFLVAEGFLPEQAGDDAIFFCWESGFSPERAFENSKVNLRELDKVKSVHEGEVVARIEPSKPGLEGITVAGKRIPARHGKKVNFTAGTNVRLSEDGTEFIAVVGGSPVVKRRSICVDPMFTIRGNVDYSIGNINFAGSINIGGDVLDGFVVKADGDIFIGGNVQAAGVVAGGDIKVRGGIITRDEGYVIADGSVYAKYIENSVIEAQGDVVCQRAIINSRINANGSVICETREGKIIGGEVIAQNEIRAKSIGTEQETPTICRVGYEFKSYEKLEALEKTMDKVKNNIKDLMKTYAAAKKGELQNISLESVRKKIAELEEKGNTFKREYSLIKKHMQLNTSAAIRSEDTLQPGSVIHIGAQKEKISKPMKFVTLTANDEKGMSISSFDSYVGRTRTTATEKKQYEITPVQHIEPDDEAPKVGADGRRLPTVLLIDDGQFNRAKLRRILTNSHFDVIGEAENGRDGLRQFITARPDIVMLDITMPEVDGITTAGAIMKIDPTANIIVLTTASNTEKLATAMAIGASDHVLKPIMAVKVIEALYRALDRRKAGQ